MWKITKLSLKYKAIIAELSSLIGLTNSGTYRNISKLVDKHLLKRYGSDRSGLWMVIKSE
jgi:DNA-binding MarR family transcriptional regulator